MLLILRVRANHRRNTATLLCTRHVVGRFLFSRHSTRSREVYLDKTRSAFIGTFVNRAVRAREGREVSRVPLIGGFTLGAFESPLVRSPVRPSVRPPAARLPVARRRVCRRCWSGDGGYHGHHAGCTRVRPREMPSCRRSTALNIGASGTRIRSRTRACTCHSVVAARVSQC